MQTSLLLVIFCTFNVALLQPCPKIVLLNGNVSNLLNYDSLQFKCHKDFQLIGARFAICDKGAWNTEIPVCVDATCPTPKLTSGLIAQKLYSGAVISFTCGPGMVRSGPQKIMCQGGRWNHEMPICTPIISAECDFEHEDLCGWSQDTEDQFDWTRHNGSTPTKNSGPLYDHTLNSESGHYLYIESSAPQKFGDRARLMSPMYDSLTVNGKCLEFYYHMFGLGGTGEVGNLDVYILDHSANMSETTATQHVFHREGNQGDRWIMAEVYIPAYETTLQLVIEATRLNSPASDIAIDDIRIRNCSSSAENRKAGEVMFADMLQPKVIIGETVRSLMDAMNKTTNDSWSVVSTPPIPGTRVPTDVKLRTTHLKQRTTAESFSANGAVNSKYWETTESGYVNNSNSRLFLDIGKNESNDVITKDTDTTLAPVVGNSLTKERLHQVNSSTPIPDSDNLLSNITFNILDDSRTLHLPHTGSPSETTQPVIKIPSSNTIIEGDDNEDTGNETVNGLASRHKHLLNIIIFVVVVIAACWLVWHWCRQRETRTHAMEKEDTQLEVRISVSLRPRESRRTWAESLV